MEPFKFEAIMKSNPPQVIISMRVYNILIGILNVTGNAVLIWALRKTGQTKTISFQVIAIMSASDLTTGITGMVLLTLTMLEKYQASWLLRFVTQIILLPCNSFSVLMVLLIALDRFLHMKYLERYSTVFTKKRGYLIMIIAFVLSLSLSLAFIPLLSQKFYTVVQLLLCMIIIAVLASILILYYKALRALRRKAHQITRTIIYQNKTLGNAAKRVSICIFVLIIPIATFITIDNVNMQLNFVDESVITTCLWYSYITFLANGFCSSIIFISQNIPIRRYLKRVTRYKWNRVQSILGTI